MSPLGVGLRPRQLTSAEQGSVDYSKLDPENSLTYAEYFRMIGHGSSLYQLLKA